jgi:DNA-binding NarL/FixJ family response regulator
VTTRVLIADDQPLMRSALRTCLDAEADLTVVGEAVDGADAVRQARRLRPDVVVMDIRMPVMDGIEATRRIAALEGDPFPRVLVMTTFDLDEHIIDALRAGASGFLVKDAPPEDLIEAVRLIAGGHALLAPSVTRRLLDLRGRTLPPLASAASDPAVAMLTAREVAVLTLVARGLSNPEIAQVMDLAVSSVKTHIGHLLAKLQFTDRVHLVVFAYEHELVRAGIPETRPEGADGPLGSVRPPAVHPPAARPGHGPAATG